jgi:hypothetical protein
MAAVCGKQLKEPNQRREAGLLARISRPHDARGEGSNAAILSQSTSIAQISVTLTHPLMPKIAHCRSA